MEPPEMINAGQLVLKRWEAEWAEEGTAAIRESIPELEPFLPWASDSYVLSDTREYIERSVKSWEAGTEFNYAIFTTVGELIGSIGLMTRLGPGVLEIGYWLRSTYTRRGYMTAAVDAIARVALALDGIDRIAIQHDVANVASGIVAERAGFPEVRQFDRDPTAPGETGRFVLRERRA
ncbi:GNAT family N-acetyltransferase [Actinoplanes sp. NPDC051851]|uniref:GNAT family N-acetyltransferase n=1 Tax=Actinoplanes sp. NPDC051851 TaxID=3154753 RepID=UPI0034499E2D